jgi:hypothetical protein
MAEMQATRRRRRKPPAIIWKRVHWCQETGNRALLSIRETADGINAVNFPLSRLCFPAMPEEGEAAQAEQT